MDPEVLMEWCSSQLKKVKKELLKSALTPDAVYHIFQICASLRWQMLIYISKSKTKPLITIMLKPGSQFPI